MYQHALENKHVNLTLRLKLFQSIITPTVCYSLDTCPLTETLKNRLDVTQRVMLRRMIGWVSFTGDTWEARGRRMKERLERALVKYPVEDWSTCIHFKKVSLMSGVNEGPAWTKLAFNWNPLATAHLNLVQPYRGVGRPFIRWNDGVVAAPVAYRNSHVPSPARVPYIVPNVGRFRHSVLHVPFFQVHNDNWW